MFVTVRENAFGEDKVLEFWENVLRSVSRKTESGGGLRNQFICGGGQRNQFICGI